MLMSGWTTSEKELHEEQSRFDSGYRAISKEISAAFFPMRVKRVTTTDTQT
jgi:hypothetical protein